MNKTLGNYLAQQNNNFPLDCETLEYLQNNVHMAEMIGAIAGNKVILSGCGVSGSSRAAGYVFLKTNDFPQGEVLYFEGGDAAHTTMYLDKTAIAVTANTDPYPNAYTQRTLKPGLGSEQYNWSDFAGLSDKTNRQLLTEIQALQAQIATLQPAPAGSIMMWPSNNIPTGWALCDGSSYSRSEYAALFAVLGTTYGYNDNSSFKLPDMRGLFVAGKGANNYSTLNQKGGTNTVILTKDQMPEHTHGRGSLDSEGSFRAVDQGSTNVSGAFTNGGSWHTGIKGGGDADTWGRIKNYKWSSGIKGELGKTGGNQSHENRPPFIVLNYIIKLK